jgi:nucleotide-binding universal stress UspA family protein
LRNRAPRFGRPSANASAEPCRKILVAHNGSTFCGAVSSLRRAGLPDNAKALVLCPTGDRQAAEVAGQQIASTFPSWKLTAEALHGSPVEVILNMSRWWRPDLLIIGSNTFARERSMASNVSLEVAHRANCSVRIVHCGAQHIGPVQVIICDSGSDECEAVMHEVAGRHWPAGTETHVVSVAQGTDELLREADRRNADTIFVGARCSFEAQCFLLGCIATAVVTRARSTVEVVRA